MNNSNESSSAASGSNIARVLVLGAAAFLAAKSLVLTTVPAGTIGVRFSSASGVFEQDLAPGYHLEVVGLHRVDRRWRALLQTERHGCGAMRGSLRKEGVLANALADLSELLVDPTVWHSERAALEAQAPAQRLHRIEQAVGLGTRHARDEAQLRLDGSWVPEVRL